MGLNRRGVKKIVRPVDKKEDDKKQFKTVSELFNYIHNNIEEILTPDENSDKVVEEVSEPTESIEEVPEQPNEELVEEVEQEEIQVEEKPINKEISELLSILDEEKEQVICVNTKVVYDDNKVASEQTGVNAGTIKRCCNGSIGSAGKDEEGNKLVWQFLKDYIEENK